MPPANFKPRTWRINPHSPNHLTITPLTSPHSLISRLCKSPLLRHPLGNLISSPASLVGRRHVLTIWVVRVCGCGDGRGERLIVDVEFKSEFEIARSTGKYNSVLQSLPAIFVGKADPLKEIILIVSDAAKQSMKKKGMYLPPWRKFKVE